MTTTALRQPRVRATDVSRTTRGRTLVDRVSLTVEAGEMVALIGGSGAGKTSLLETLIGCTHPPAGRSPSTAWTWPRTGARIDVGLVPQDDIIHVDLPLRSTLRYAAKLRLPRTVSDAELDQIVDRVLSDLELTERADVVVRNLSGGQRKRASIAVELLTRPAVLALDEPTSGLDPATSREVLAVLRRLADTGTTVLLTTHAPDDVLSCDRVVVLAPGGRLAFDGAPEAAAPWFGVPDLGGVYAAVAAGVVDFSPEPTVDAVEPVDEPAPAPPRPTLPARPTWRRQLGTLVHRGADLMVRNRLTAAILVGSPVLVIAMLATLFRRGTVVTDPVAGVQLAYWIAFAGFFFGLTYGLLQIVTETAVLRRELSWGMSLTAYVTSKLVVLLPLLVAVDVSLFTVLRLLDRLPAADAGTWGKLAGVFLLDATAGLALGLLASASVTSPAQATLALPMLCFPQVLFSGAMVPVATMTGAGDAISRAMSDRWGFEAVARLLELDASDPGVRAWSGAITGGIGAHVAILVAMTVGATVATMAVLSRRTRV